jgi:peptidoglycan/xylan/chitin deacetylase (PgdA/CDA1 family)
MLPFIPKHGWGPDHRRGALTLSFDNFGEAAEIEMGMWGDEPVGRHFTADFIPRLIETLGQTRGTYFIEAINVSIYPEQIKRWHASGNEVAMHAWRHEVWANCDAARRRDILQRSLAAFADIGIRPIGFRPPGGAIPAEAWDEFEQAGLLYCSDLGTPGIKRSGNMLSLPFQWHTTDVYMIEEVMGFMRVRCGDPEAPYSIDTWIRTLDEAVDALLEEGGQRTVLFHPHFIGSSDEKLDVLKHLLARARREDIWIAPAGEVARFAMHEYQQTAALAG